MTYQRANFEHRRAPLHSEFGEQMLARHFGPATQTILDAMPLFKRGKNKGKRKGFVQWLKVVEGGWSNNLPVDPHRGVVKPGTQFVRVTIGFDERSPALLPRGMYAERSDDEWISLCAAAIKQIAEADERARHPARIF